MQLFVVYGAPGISKGDPLYEPFAAGEVTNAYRVRRPRRPGQKQSDTPRNKIPSNANTSLHGQHGETHTYSVCMPGHDTVSFDNAPSCSEAYVAYSVDRPQTLKSSLKHEHLKGAGCAQTLYRLSRRRSQRCTSTDRQARP